MTALGFALLLLGALLVVAEAHVPGGVLGGAGGLALVVGGLILVTGLGAGAAVAVPVAIGVGGAAVGWTLLVVPKAIHVRRERIQSGAETLAGRLGVVRQWEDPAGQVYVDGALWRARQSWTDDELEPLHVGDRVVVERVQGLTLSVRRAEEWELIA